MSILSLSQYRTFTGDVDTLDATVQNALDRYAAIIEGYCNKRWGTFSVTQTFVRPSNSPLFLSRDFIDEVTAITVNGDAQTVADFTIDLVNGLVYFDSTYLGESTVVVTFSVDREAPDDVKHVQTALVKGFLAGTSGGDAELRPVSKETVFGVSSTNYSVRGDDSYSELGGFTVLLDRHCDPVLV